MVLLLLVAHVALSSHNGYSDVPTAQHRVEWSLASLSRQRALTGDPALTGWTLRVMLFEVKALHRDGECWMVHCLFGRWRSTVEVRPRSRRLGVKLPSLWAPYVRSAWWVATGPCVITEEDCPAIGMRFTEPGLH